MGQVGRPRHSKVHVGITSRCYRQPTERVSVIPSVNPHREGERIPVSNNVVKIKSTNKVSKGASNADQEM